MIQNDLLRFQAIVEKLLKVEQEKPVVEPIVAKELFDHLDLSLKEEALDDDSFYKSLEELVMQTPRTATRLFFNQLFGGRKSKSVLGDLLAVMLNNSMYTYKVAGPMVGVEKEVVRNIARLVGYGDQADGTIAPGGSMSNFMAMIMARDAFNADARFEGIQNKMTIYTSSTCHYSIAKNAAMMGVGRDQVKFIKTDERGVMDVEALNYQIEIDKQQGYHPFFVNATAGSTVLGSFDPIDQIAVICKEQNLWLHVDGAYCGSVIFSKEYKHLVKGAELADSYSLNAHKMLGTPLTCSIVVVKDKKYLSDSFSDDARYLYQTDGDDFNLGKTSIQCGRRNDALKLWTLWKSLGTKGLANLVDHQFHLAEVARSYVTKHPDYTLYSYNNSISICFNYKDIPAERLCTTLYEQGRLMVGYGTFRDEEFVRLVTINADNRDQDILNFFYTLEAFVEEHEELLISPQVMDS